MLTGALIVWFAEAPISAAIVAADVGHTPESPVLKWGSWFIYCVALTAGFAISDPLNWWLVSAGLNDGMMTVRPGARAPGRALGRRDRSRRHGTGVAVHLPPRYAGRHPGGPAPTTTPGRDDEAVHAPTRHRRPRSRRSPADEKPQGGHGGRERCGVDARARRRWERRLADGTVR